jgi:hypothetical protein
MSAAHPKVRLSAPATAARQDVLLFLEAALPVAFETRFIGETSWSRASIFEVAGALASYHPDLLGCLRTMLEGREVTTGLSAYRCAETE